MIRHDFPTGTWLTGDTFEGMATLPDQSVDMILADLPYGTTQNKWDSVLPLDRLWAEYWRICRGAVVLTAQPPFDKSLGASQIDRLKYEWIWEKSKPTGHLNAKRQPLRAHENILVFHRDGASVYNPQGLLEKQKPTVRKGGDNGGNYGKSDKDAIQTHENYPTSILRVPSIGRTVHPTQKPVALFDYLIRTYTDPSATILDNTAGSGTTAVAAIRSGRVDVGFVSNETKRIVTPRCFGSVANTNAPTRPFYPSATSETARPSYLSESTG